MIRLLLLPVLAFVAAAQTFPIAGVVIDAGSGTPMGRVRVMLTPAGRTADMRAVVTASDGRFSFDVPKGKFGLTAEYRGYRQPFGQSGPAVGFGVSIYTGPDHDTSNLSFRWFALSAISGKVTDERGEPIESALVQLIRVSVVGGRKTRTTVAWARSNDLGEYRFGQRPGGAYYLAVTAEPWFAARTQSLRTAFPGSENARAEPVQSYSPVYFPNTSDPSGARPLELPAGAEVTADFRLTTISGVNVRVRSAHERGKTPLITLLTEGVAGVETHQRQVWLTGTEQVISGVLPGHYTVSVDGRNGDTSSGRMSIDVGQSDVDVEIAMRPAPKVSGKIIFKNSGQPPARQVYIRLVDEATGGVINRAMDSTGGFSFDNVRTGRQLLQLTGADGFFVTQMTAEGASVDGPAIDVTPGAAIQLSIVASGEVGVLKGFVMNGDKPVPGVLAVLAPKSDSKDRGDYRGFQTDSDGSFDYQNVRAGEYLLFAVEKLDLEYTNPAAVHRYFSTAIPIRITDHGTAVQNVALSPLAP